MKKTINEELNKIKSIMGLITEQSSKCEYTNWKNGDGVNRPKITISQSESGVNAIYEGPETGFCIQHSKGSTGDSIHQLAGVVRTIVSPLLKQLYSQGIYVKPDLKGIKMNKKDRYFEIDIPFIKTTEDKAITNFNERGGWGHSGMDTLSEFLSTIENNPQYGMIEKITKVASGGKSSDITEHWISFRDLKTYPIKTTQTNNSPVNVQEKIEIDYPNDLIGFRDEIRTKTLGQRIKKIAFDMDKGKAIFYTDPNSPEIKRMTLAWNTASDGDSCPSCDAVESKNAGNIEVAHEGRWDNGKRYFKLYFIKK